jgi:hypothetical protein
MLWAEYVARLREKRHKGTGGETRKKEKRFVKARNRWNYYIEVDIK